MKKGLLIIAVFAAATSYGYRDLETGTFLTRDPIGYGDGPNVYCYVKANPITEFDALGLYAKVTHSEPGIKWRGWSNGFQRQKTHKVLIEIPVVINDQSGENLSQSQMNARIKATEERFSGTFGEYEVETKIEILSHDKSLPPAEQTKQKVNCYTFIPNDNKDSTGGNVGPLNTDVTIEVDSGSRNIGAQAVQRTVDHETGHAVGVRHDGTKGSVMADNDKMQVGSSVDVSRDVNVLPSHISQVLYNRKNNDVTKVKNLDLEAVREEKKNEPSTDK